MEKLPVKSIIKFRRIKKDGSRITLLRNLNKKKEPRTEDKKSNGGDYWISCCSALANVFKTDDLSMIETKIADLQQKVESATDERTKNRHQKNIDLLTKFQEFDFTHLKPISDVKMLQKKDEWNILNVLELPIYLRPDHVFSFSNKDFKETGAIWFIAQKGGFDKTELSVFCDVLHRYLQKNFSAKYKVSAEYCVVVDVFTTRSLTYEDLSSRKIQSPLEATLNDIRRLL